MVPSGRNTIKLAAWRARTARAFCGTVSAVSITVSSRFEAQQPADLPDRPALHHKRCDHHAERHAKQHDAVLGTRQNGDDREIDRHGAAQSDPGCERRFPQR